MTAWKFAIPVLLLFVGLATCSEGNPPTLPNEQQLHSSDGVAASGETAWHPFRCSEGEPLFVSYKDNGLRIDVRAALGEPPITLTAPAQGLQYVGETATAVFKGSELIIEVGDGPRRTCTRKGVT
ncbi:MAG: hypothetical protein C0473_03410 [Cyanobacteria bacterium DS3.002]|jgi:hypothetical protein|nr:hypothetical protein [Cyanobacteria bacterium DS3.002]